jgi:hypothetical protein
MLMNNFNKIKSLAVAMLIPAIGFCQEQTTKESSVLILQMYCF